MRILSLITITAMLITSLCGCVSNSAEASALESTSSINDIKPIGGYTTPQSPKITDELKEICAKALSSRTDMSYTPIALIRTQVVAGTNYIILFNCKHLIDNSVDTYSIGYIYEDLNGGSTCTKMLDSTTPSDIFSEEPLPGGLTKPKTPALTEAALNAFKKATAEPSCDYTPLALLSTQVVAGTNYKIFCSKAVVGKTDYYILTIYEDLQGNAKITDTVKLDVAQ